MSKISDFKELFDWICYDYEDHYGLKKDSEGNFYINKLYISRDKLTYKTETYDLEKGMFEKVEKLYSLFYDNSIRYINED